jgi:8-oxo-dGTP pyrophosphatase MutT (NUDIX family)
VRRELAEELEIELTELVSYLGSEEDPGSEFVLHFVEVVAAGEPAAVEHDEVAWVRLQDVERYALAPGDRSFIERWRRQAATS